MGKKKDEWMSDDPYERLSSAIILRAAEDYRLALRGVGKKPDDRILKGEVIWIESFFRSEWFRQLTKMDGEYLISRLREEEAAGRRRV